MIRVGLARASGGYAGLAPPWSPAVAYPELTTLFGENVRTSERNEVYAAVRGSLRALGLDEDRFGTCDWNPIGDLAERGARIVLKPNFIRHWNPSPEGTLDSVITHGSVVRAVADYAFIAAGAEGSVAIAEAAQQDCRFSEIRRLCGLDSLTGFYSEEAGRALDVIDLRREEVSFEDGIIVERRALPGDPLGYRAVDLGKQSFFTGSDLDARRFRGADYDPGPTTEHHVGGRNAYLLSESVLRADLVINLPKIKTHKKTGVTLALKNLVGINGDKNWLPHHSVGSAAEGGDEYPDGHWIDRWRSRAVEWARPHLARARLLSFFRLARRIEASTRGDDFVRSGNWHGNQTAWRMVLDLNRCLYYTDADRTRLDAPRPLRRVLSILDGVVAGEGEGPLAPRDVSLGVVLSSCDPVAADIAAIRAMGFDETRVPKVQAAMADTGPRITDVRSADDVAVFEASRMDFSVAATSLAMLAPARTFTAHPGWKGALEAARP